MKAKVTDAVESARPYVERVAHDDELQAHVKNAYESARKIYNELFTDRSATGVAMRVAHDAEIQDELRKAVEELRKAGSRVRGDESHTGRNITIFLVGIALGVLFNPATGPETRRWLKEKILGPEQSFEYQSNEG
jgi:hypothetical protein